MLVDSDKRVLMSCGVTFSLSAKGERRCQSWALKCYHVWQTHSGSTVHATLHRGRQL